METVLVCIFLMFRQYWVDLEPVRPESNSATGLKCVFKNFQSLSWPWHRRSVKHVKVCQSNARRSTGIDSGTLSNFSVSSFNTPFK